MYQHRSLAMGSQGNGLISRGIIHSVSMELRQRPAQDILVGIMWSGFERHEFYQHRPRIDYNDGCIENPTGFIEGHEKHWVIVNHYWKNRYARVWYSQLHDTVGAMIQSIENILRTQWFLQKHNVPYFMTTYTGETFAKDIIPNRDVDSLYNMIDFDTFLPVVGEYEWCRDNSAHDFPMPGDHHPGTEQHKDFVDQVIIPWLVDKGLLKVGP